ncbi:MAG: DoxX family membrane protein [Flavihumibacter sp.]
MKTALSLSRYIVGILFIISALVKANDPLGLSYKMQEFFEVWGWHSLNDYTLALSVLMIAFEIIAGVAVIIGWQMKLFSWLLLLLILFFTFLTGYALFSGKIKTCGCFGDCIPLTAAQSFLKDIFLLLLILLLFFNRHRFRAPKNTGRAVLLLLASVLVSFGLQWYVLKHIPLVDCLPYKKGKVIQDQLKVPPGAIPDSTVISFVYNKGGKEVEFTADAFPEDFSEDSYQFLRRYDKLVRKGNAEPPIKDFVLLAPSGADSTAEILNTPGNQYWLFVRSIDESSAPAVKKAIETLKPLLIITPVEEALRHQLADALQNSTVLKCDAVAVKTAARNPQTLYQVNQGRIIDKWALRDAPQIH